jgi:hypothetical protein
LVASTVPLLLGKRNFVYFSLGYQAITVFMVAPAILLFLEKRILCILFPQLRKMTGKTNKNKNSKKNSLLQIQIFFTAQQQKKSLISVSHEDSPALLSLKKKPSVVLHKQTNAKK